MGRQAKLWDTQKRYLEMIALTLRPDTVIGARTVSGGFVRYLEEEQPEISCFSQLTRRHIDAWLLHLGRKRLKPITRRSHITKLRQFLETLRYWGWKEAPRTELFRRGDLPPPDRGLPKPLSQRSDRILQEELRKRDGIVYKAILLMRLTGLRRREIHELKVDSLKKLPGGEWILHVPLGKLHNERILPVDERTVEIFQEILRLRGSPPPTLDPETGKLAQFVLTRPDGRRFCREVFRYHLEKIEQEAQLDEHPTPHRLRHTYATEMLRAGVSLPVLMKLLGHRSVGMTLRYTQITGVDVRRAYFAALGSTRRDHEVPLPAVEPSRARERKLTSWHSVAGYVETVAREVETFRRDHSSGCESKRAQRLIERLRRIARDFERLGV